MSMLQAIMIREWKRILRLPVFRNVLLVIPPVLFLFYALVYQSGEVNNLDFAIWDEDQTKVSRQLTFMLSQRHTIRLVGGATDEQTLKAKIERGELMGAVHFPKNMQNNLFSGRSSSAIVYTNAAYLVPAKMIYKSVAEVILTASAGVTLQKLKKQGVPENKALALANPLTLVSYQLYNPDYNYQEYLVPGLITVALQMILIIASMLALNYEQKDGGIEELKQLSGGSAALVVFGKMMAHLVIAWINFLLVVGIIFPLFEIGVPPATGKFFLLFTLFVLSSLSVGFFISALFKDLMLAGDVALFYTSPAFVFSGFTFPRWAMPWYDQYYAMIMPYTPFLDSFFKVYYMDLPLRYATDEMVRLSIFIVALIPPTIVLFRQSLKQPSTHATTV